MIVTTNPPVVECENPTCRKRLTLKNIEPMAEELQSKGWGWLRGDECYDHYCSEKCRTKLSAQLKK